MIWADFVLLFELIFGFKLVKIIGAKGWGGGRGGGSLNFLGPKFKTKLNKHYVFLFPIAPYSPNIAPYQCMIKVAYVNLLKCISKFNGHPVDSSTRDEFWFSLWEVRLDLRWTGHRV